MSDIITFILPEYECETNIKYHPAFDIISLKSQNAKEQRIEYGGPYAYDGRPYEGKLMLCDQDLHKLQLNKIAIDKKNHVVNLELQTKDAKQSKLIKSSAKACGFKVK